MTRSSSAPAPIDPDPGNGSLSTTPAPSNDSDSDSTPARKAYEPYPPLWETATSEGTSWSQYVYDLIGSSDVAAELLPGSQDMGLFCPKYDTLNTDQKVNFWAFLISAVVKYESDFDPLDRYLESTMGEDPITHEPVYSEGLMQLSYQDIQSYPFCQFDWSKDSQLSPDDPHKTILDPYINLDCGTRILAHQIQKKGNIALSSGVYWSTLKLNGRYNRLAQIESLTRSIPFCE